MDINVKLKVGFPPVVISRNMNGHVAELPPGPIVDAPSDEELNEMVTAKKILGLNILGGRILGEENKDLPPYAIFRGKSGNQVVSIHNSDTNLHPFLYSYFDTESEYDVEVEIQGLFELTRHGAYDYTLYLGAYEPDLSYHTNHIDGIRSRANDINAQFLDAVENYVKLKSSTSGSARNLWIVGPEWAVVPKGGLPKASLSGKLVPLKSAGDILHSLIHSRPARFREVYPNYTDVREHERYAVHRQIRSRGDHIRIGTAAIAYWAYGQVSLETMSLLLKKNIDILLRVEFIRGTTKAFFTPCLRKRVPVRKLDDLYDLDEELLDIGNFERVLGKEKDGVLTNDDLMDAWHAFTLSRPLPRRFYRHSVPRWIAPRDLETESDKPEKPSIFGLITKNLAPIGDPKGYVVLGFANGIPYLRDPLLEPSWIYTGTSKQSGKSTTCAFHVNQETENVAWVDLTTSPLDSAKKWTEDFSDYPPILLELPDADTILNPPGKVKTSKGRVQEYQQELHRDDKSLLIPKLHDRFLICEKEGNLNGLRLTFNVTSGNTVRYMNAIDIVLGELKEFMQDWHARTLQYMILVVDNFAHLKSQQSDHAVLDSIPWNTAVNLAKSVAWYINNGANHGVHLRLIAHSKGDFIPLVGDYYKDFALHIEMGGNQSHIANVIVPSSGERLARVDMTLDAKIRGYIEQLTPDQLREFKLKHGGEQE